MWYRAACTPLLDNLCEDPAVPSRLATVVFQPPHCCHHLSIGGLWAAAGNVSCCSGGQLAEQLADRGWMYAALGLEQVYKSAQPSVNCAAQV